MVVASIFTAMIHLISVTRIRSSALRMLQKVCLLSTFHLPHNFTIRSPHLSLKRLPKKPTQEHRKPPGKYTTISTKLLSQVRASTHIQNKPPLTISKASAEMPRLRLPPVRTDPDNISQYLIGRILGRDLRFPILSNPPRRTNKSAKRVAENNIKATKNNTKATKNNTKHVMYCIEYYGYEDHPPEWVSREDIDPAVVRRYDAAAPIAVDGVRSRVVMTVVGVERGGKESKAGGKGSKVGLLLDC